MIASFPTGSDGTRPGIPGAPRPPDAPPSRGSISNTTTADGTLKSALHYSAYGEERYASGDTPTNYRYTGQLSRMETVGLYYYNARWYDPVLSRFLSPDSIVPNLYNPQSLDRYSYGLNNPSRYNDPTGHFACGDGINDPRCNQFDPPTIPNVVFPQPSAGSIETGNSWDLLNSNPYYLLYWPWLMFPQNEPCLGNFGCWGGIGYAHDMVRINGPYFNKVSKVTGDISGMSGYLLDYYEEWSGLKLSLKIGFGLDALKQWSNDAQRDDLSLMQRLNRASVVGTEGIGVSTASQSVGGLLGTLAFKASLEPSVVSGQLWLPPVALWGGYTVGYGVTNATISMVTDVANDRFVFPLIQDNVP